MISDKLYSLAFEYKKTKLWNKLWDTHLFAINLSGGRIGYISIMGFHGEHWAVGLYIGEEGLNSLLTIMSSTGYKMSPFEYHEILLQQNCLQCIFTGKDNTSEEERDEAKNFARSHGIKISGKNAYPIFVKYIPYYSPWKLQTEQEQEDLCEALTAAIHLAKILEKKTPSQIGLTQFNYEVKEILMLKQQDGVYTPEKAQPIKILQKNWPEPKVSNDITIAKLKKLKRTKVLECAVIHAPNPVQDKPEEIPYFPALLLAVEPSADYIVPIPPVDHYEKEPEQLLNLFMDALLQQKLCPTAIKACDEQTYAFAKAFCDRMNIPLSMDDDLPALRSAEYDFWESFSMNEDEELNHLMDSLSNMLDMDDEALSGLPDEFVQMLKMLSDSQILPDDLEYRLNERFQFADESKPKPKKSNTRTMLNKSYVISVSLGSGCYRHIQISSDSSLFALHCAILDAFEFDDDHAHAFFMDNMSWSERDCYYANGVEEYYRTTNKYNLSEAGLYKGKQFKYIFDFGDEWTFQCKVLRTVDEDTDTPKIIRSKGEAPEQYPDWDDEW